MPPAIFYTKLPGEIADADTQCEYQYGPGYKRCPQTEVGMETSSKKKYLHSFDGSLRILSPDTRNETHGITHKGK